MVKRSCKKILQVQKRHSNAQKEKASGINKAALVKFTNQDFAEVCSVEVEADNQICMTQESLFQKESEQLMKIDTDMKKGIFLLEPRKCFGGILKRNALRK